MVLAHLGLAVTIVGIAFSQNYSIERDVKMKPGIAYQFVLIPLYLMAYERLMALTTKVSLEVFQ